MLELPQPGSAPRIRSVLVNSGEALDPHDCTKIVGVPTTDFGIKDQSLAGD